MPNYVTNRLEINARQRNSTKCDGFLKGKTDEVKYALLY